MRSSGGPRPPLTAGRWALTFSAKPLGGLGDSEPRRSVFTSEPRWRRDAGRGSGRELWLGEKKVK